MTSQHTVKAFDAELGELTGLLRAMAGLAERQIGNAVGSLIQQCTALAREVIAGDLAVDAFQREIENKAVVVIARRQPMAVDLRDIIGALRIASDLERIGDLAKNVAKRTIALDGGWPVVRPLEGMGQIARLVVAQLRLALDGFGQRNGASAVAALKSDEEIDALHASISRDLIEHMLNHPGHIALGVHLLFCAKNIEHMGDHAVRIARAVYYVIEGHPLAHSRREPVISDRVATAKRRLSLPVG
jgi:phosphate transport system protein